MVIYEQNIDQIIADLAVDPANGLSVTSVAQKQQQYGKNQFAEQRRDSIFMHILHNLKDISVIILLVAAALSLFMAVSNIGDKGYIEFLVIIGIVILNITLAITQERSAEKSLEALQDLNSPTSLVLRDGTRQRLDSVELVPGDILILETGSLISADARLLEASDLAVDESVLTGESVPVQKNADCQLSGRVAVADQLNMVFSGCLVTAGRARAIVTATGMQTQMGLIAGYLGNNQRLKTPLQVRITNVGKVISAIGVLSALAIFAIGFVRGTDVWELIFVAIALAVAAVPEMLLLIVTLSLAHGVTQMAARNALIRKLPAVETLGCTSVICTDKTGTLTQNRMTIQRLWLEGGEPVEAEAEFQTAEMAFLEKFALVVNAVAETQPDGSVKVLGSPTEAMVINLLLAKGGNKTALESRYPRVAEVPFSSARKMSTAILRDPAGGYLVLTCGAFDVLPFADLAAQAPTAEARAQAQAQMRRRQEVHDGFAQQSLRMLALGSRHIQELPAADDLASVERDLVFEGLVGSMDPPRAGVAAAIATARNAGIRTVMITGDHAVTAAAIAEQIGLALPGDQVLTGVELAAMADAQLVENVAQYSVYARVSPEDKIRIVEAWQEHDQVVAMTGDGVNDAPALKAADVGVAMGITGTEVSKSAADIVLTDDNYSTIVKAVRQGREVFANIRKTIFFLLCVNFSEIVIMLGATIIGWGLPLTPIMLLLINVVGDGIPGLSLSREKSDDTIMLRNPIGRRESLFAGLQFVIAQQTIAFVLVGWAAFYLGAHVPLVAGLEPNLQLGQTMCFMVVGWTSILHVFNVRSRKSVFQSNIRANPRLAVSAVAMLVLFTLLAAVPVLRMIFGLYALGLYHWLLAIALSIIPLLIAEIGKLIRHGSESWRYRRRLVQHQGLSDY